jgi:CBS domain-containing protein
VDVERILATKGREVATTRPEGSVAMAAGLLRARGIGALVVSGDGQRVDGILSERDIVRGLAHHGADVLGLRVSDLMSRTVHTCTPQDTLKSIMARMTRHRVRHLPVVDGGRLCGIVSIGDVVKHRLDEIEDEVNVLRDAYIAHRR